MNFSKKMCPKGGQNRDFYLVVSMAGLVKRVRESYQCIPAKRWNFCAPSAEKKIGENTQHLG
ncbi:hypothetical protein NP493_637g00041 [Ridgeia piscesae]|uniref:Uncharacterized protein n=1 Tax=Ridgeia piscesae TaxID=27915 RepID=A0AAD9NRI1_RIDPI|nr:hypothetical protein NP493_637g00041 [Ridgeia piscesae]